MYSTARDHACLTCAAQRRGWPLRDTRRHATQGRPRPVRDATCTCSRRPAATPTRPSGRPEPRHPHPGQLHQEGGYAPGRKPSDLGRHQGKITPVAKQREHYLGSRLPLPPSLRPVPWAGRPELSQRPAPGAQLPPRVLSSRQPLCLLWRKPPDNLRSVDYISQQASRSLPPPPPGHAGALGSVKKARGRVARHSSLWDM